jgi:anti-sigma regulatory factor (Ser/Thr protein kinase)
LTLGPWRWPVPCGRALAVACLAGWGLSTARDSVELIVSQLLANAITASNALERDPHPVRLWLQAGGGQILIMVGDANADGLSVS